MKRKLLVAGCLAMLLQPAIASAEHPWLTELHIGLSSPSDDIADANVDAGFVFGGSISYHFIDNRIGPYFGWSVIGFDADSDTFSGLDTIAYQRVSLGISYQDLIAGGVWRYYIRAGVTSGRLRLEDNDDDELADTGSGAGWEAMAGLSYKIKNN